MKRTAWLKWLVAGLVLVLVSAGALWSVGWLPVGGDPSIELDERTAPNTRVQNGSAYDRAAVDLGVHTTVVLPDDALVRRTPRGGAVELFMKKTLGFGGHPPESMSVRDARRNMGCAVRTDGGALVVATFGEWDTHIEGRAYLRLIAVVPDGVLVEQRAGLSGPDSGGREWGGKYLAKPRDAAGGYWYGPTSPAEGWVAVPDVPDRDRTARGLGATERPGPGRR